MDRPFRRPRRVTHSRPARAFIVAAEPLESRTLLSFELVQNFGPSSEAPVQGLVRLDDRIYFTAQNPTQSSFGVWSSDGTAAGTLDLAGGDSATLWRRGGPVIAGNKLFFQGQLGSTQDVWASQGTPATTTRLAVYGGGGNNNTDTNTWGAALGDRMVFLGWAGAGSQIELFVTDGTDAGTTPLSASLPAPHVRANTVIGGVNGLAWFTDATEQGLARLGVTDGTPSGTRIIADLNTGVGLVRPEYFTAAGNQVFFQVSTSQGLRLWHSDGTPAGTGPVDTFERPVAAAMTELGGKLLYAAEGGLYLTDGTRAGTQLVASTGYSTNFGGTPHLFRAGDQVWFMNGENWRRGDGRGGLWRTDGTAPGTLQVLPNVLVNNFFRFGDRVWLGGLRLVVDLSVNPLEPHATGITDPPWPYQPYYPPFTLAELGSFVYFPDAQGLYRTAVPDHYLANVSLKLFNDADGDGTHDPSEGVYTSPALDAYVDLDNDGALGVGEPHAGVRADGTVLLTGVLDGHYTVRLSENGARFTTPPTFAIDVAGADLSLPVGVNRNVHVRGTVYDDRNADHLRGADEPALEGRPVYLDLDQDNVRDPDEPFTLTGPDGSFRFEHLSGYGPVRAEPPPGWRPTEQEGGHLSFVTPNAADLDFGAFGLTSQPPTGSVSFQTYLDYDGNGVKHDFEPFAAFRMVGFLDADADGALDAGEPTYHMYNGLFSFGYVLPGTYRPAVVLPPGWTLETPAPVTVASNSVNNLPPLALRPNDQVGSISGTVYMDDDFDGVRDAGEPAVRTNGTVVFLDTDGDGAWSLDPLTEPATITDALGRYRFPGLTAGTYRVGLDTRSSADGYIAVSPRPPALLTVNFDGTTPTQDVNFGVTSSTRIARAAGRVYQDVNGNGAFDAGDVPIPNALVYRDVFGHGRFDSSDSGVLTGPDGTYAVPMEVGTTQLVAVVLPAGWSAVSATSGNVSPVRFQTIAGPDFRIKPTAAGAPLPAAVVAHLFHDLNVNGVRDPFEPDGIPSVTGTVGPKPLPFLDSDGDGALDVSEPLGFFNDRGEGLFGGLAPGHYAVRLSTGQGWSQTQPLLAPRDATPAAGERADLVFGAAFAPATASGVVYLDANANGQRDEGEQPAAGARITLDLDGNGFNGADPFSVTDAQGRFFFGFLSSGVYRAAIVSDPNYKQTDPANAAPLTLTLHPNENLAGLVFGADHIAGAMSGRLFYDNNRDGVMNGSDGPVAGMQVRVQDTVNATKSWMATTNQQGTWHIDGIPAGNYQVSAAILSQWEPTVPASPGTYTLTTGRGEDVAGLDFAFHIKRVGFEGSVFNDATANGWDATDPPAAGITVYLDRNTNGWLDAGDLTTVTDAAGKFTFRDLEIERDQWTFRFVRPSQTVAAPESLTIYTPTPGTTGTVPRFLYYRPQARFISGTAYHDANANGRRDPGELPIAGRNIGFDQNRNGVLDGSDRFATTDDEGWYVIPFGDLRDLYFVRDMLPPNWVGTDPPDGAWRVMSPNASQTYPNTDFGSISWPDAGKAKVFARNVVYNTGAATAAVSTTPAGAALAPKRALLAGESAGFNNVTAFARGINGVSVDLAGLDPATVLTADDFQFAVSTAPSSQWTAAPVMPAVSIHHGEGLGQSDRVLISFPDNAIRNAWLRVTIPANARTRLAAPEVFYFGNLIGDTGNDRGTPTVNASDLALTRAAVLKTDAASLNRFDFNRDGKIDATDVLLVRNNQRHSLPLFTAPAAATVSGAASDTTPVPAAAPGGLRPQRRSLFAEPAQDLLA